MASQPASSRPSADSAEQPQSPATRTSDDNLRDEERALGRSRGSSTALEEDSTELQPRPGSTATAATAATGYVKRKTSQLLRAVTPGSGSGPTSPIEAASLPPALADLVEAYARSDLAEDLVTEMDGAAAAEGAPDVSESAVLRGRKRASWIAQFKILSGRAFKNLYRDPALLATHYISAFILARAFPLFILPVSLATS